MDESKKRQRLKGIAVLSLFAGAFFIGGGLGTVMENQRLRSFYENSQVGWQRDMAAGVGEEEVRDRKNQELAGHMQHISMERELHFMGEDGLAQARIAVDENAEIRGSLAIIRDATGEELYRSGMIDPGYYIEKIRLDSSLTAGYYPSTAVWSLYSSRDEYIGDVVWKVAVIIQK